MQKFKRRTVLVSLNIGGVLHLPPQILGLNHGAEIGIRFWPHAFVRVLIAVLAVLDRLAIGFVLLAGIEPADVREEPLIIDDAIEHLARVLVMVPADRRPIEPAVCNADRERLPT